MSFILSVYFYLVGFGLNVTPEYHIPTDWSQDYTTKVDLINIDLGPDVEACDSTVLKIEPGSGSVTWSTGSSSDSIIVKESGLYWVEVSDNESTFRDSINVLIYPPPSSSSFADQLTDTTICGFTPFIKKIDTDDDLILWYNNLEDEVPIAVGEQVTLIPKGSGSFFVRSASLGDAQTTGYSGLVEGTASLYINLLQRGLIFDIHSATLLESVRVYPDNAVNITIDVLDNLGNLVNTKDVEISEAAEDEGVVVPLNFYLLPGNDYKILLNKAEGPGKLLFMQFPNRDSLPVGIDDLIDIKSDEERNERKYNYFYDFVVRRELCSSAFVPFKPSIELPLQLADSLFACEPSLISGGDFDVDFLWSTGEVSSSIQVDTSGLYIVTADNGNGCIVKDSIYVDFPPQLDLGEDGTLCGNVLNPNFDNDNFSYVWSDNTTADSLIIIQSGTYFLKVTTDKGCILTDSIEVTSFVDFPVLDLPDDTLVCGTSLVIDLTQEGVKYDWSNGNQGGVLTLTESDTLSVILTRDICSVGDTMAVEITAIPEPTFVSDTILCGIDTIRRVSNNSSQLSLWYDTESGENPLFIGKEANLFVNKSQTFYLEELNIFERSISAGFDSLLEEERVRYTSLKNIGLVFNVKDGIFLESTRIFPTEPGPIRIELQDSTGRVLNFREFSITTLSNSGVEVPLAFYIPPGQGYRLILKDIFFGRLAWVGTRGTNDFPFVYGNSFEIIGSFNAAGLIIDREYYYFFDIKVKNQFCTSNRTPFSAEVKLPIQLDDSVFSCEPLELNPGIFDATYEWSTGADTKTILADTSGLYEVRVSDGIDCEVTDSIKVEIPKEVGLPLDGILCGNELSTRYSFPESEFQWSTGDTLESIMIENTGTYSVIVNTPENCVLIDTVSVQGFDEFPDLNLGQDTRACDSIILDAGLDGVNYQWSTGANSREIRVTSSGSYYVEVINQNNCISRDTVSLAIFDSPVAFFDVPDTIVNPGLNVQFVNLSSFGNYNWKFGDGAVSSLFNPLHTYPDTGFYCVTLTVEDLLNGCGADTIEDCFYLKDVVVNNLAEIEEREFQLFPNPVKDQLTIKPHDTLKGIFDWHITDPRGKILTWESAVLQPSFSISTEGLAPGIYYLVLIHDGRTYTRKFMKY